MASPRTMQLAPQYKDVVREVSFAVVSMSVSLVAVFIPILFMGGIIGRLFREFAVTLSVSIGVSAVLSLTLTAMMCAHLLRPEPKPEERSKLYRWSESAFEGAIALYDRGLKIVLRHELTTLLVTIATVVVTALLAIDVPKGFFPQQDTGAILGVTEAAADVSFPKMMELQRAAADNTARNAAQSPSRETTPLAGYHSHQCRLEATRG